jgi:hypothetical protein
MCMWRNVTQAFENRKREIGRRQLMSETFADQPRQVSLMVESVEASDNAARAVAKDEHGQAGFSGFYDRRDRFNITDIVFKSFDIKALAIRISAAAQIHGVYRQTIGDELLGDPSVIAAVGVETWNDDDGPAGLAIRTPRSKEYL